MVIRLYGYAVLRLLGYEVVRLKVTATVFYLFTFFTVLPFYFFTFSPPSGGLGRAFHLTGISSLTGSSPRSMRPAWPASQR